jgi:hypothetical protein
MLPSLLPLLVASCFAPPTEETGEQDFHVLFSEHQANSGIMETSSIISMNWSLKEYMCTPFLKRITKLLEDPDNLPMKKLNILEKD